MPPKLRQRIITGVSVAAVFIAATWWLPVVPLILVIGGLVALAAWEWAGLMGLRQQWSRAAYALALVIGMVFLYVYCELGGEPPLERVQPILGLAGLWWAIALLWIMGYPLTARLWGNPVMLALMGALVLLPAWLAAAHLLSHGDIGRLALIGMVAVVAATDVGAYFIGCRFGRRKMAPVVSPAKTWAGFWGGIALCLPTAFAVAAGIYLYFWEGLLGASPVPPLDSLLISARDTLLGWREWLPIAVAVSLASTVGDLLESMVKRHAGVKDSGALLPGHGGLLDRIDGITAAAPVFALCLILAGWF